MIKLYPEYEKLLASGEYKDLDDLRTALGLEYLEVFEYVSESKNNDAATDSPNKKQN